MSALALVISFIGRGIKHFLASFGELLLSPEIVQILKKMNGQNAAPTQNVANEDKSLFSTPKKY